MENEDLLEDTQGHLWSQHHKLTIYIFTKHYNVYENVRKNEAVVLKSVEKDRKDEITCYFANRMHLKIN